MDVGISHQRVDHASFQDRYRFDFTFSLHEDIYGPQPEQRLTIKSESLIHSFLEIGYIHLSPVTLTSVHMRHPDNHFWNKLWPVTRHSRFLSTTV